MPRKRLAEMAISSVPNRILIVGSTSSAQNAEGLPCPLPESWGCPDRIDWGEVPNAQLDTSTHALLLLDATHAPEDARSLLRRLRQNRPRLLLFAMVPADDLPLIQLASEVVDDFVLTPGHPEELSQRLSRLLGSPLSGPSPSDVAATLAREIGARQIVGRDPAFTSVLSQISLFAANEAPVLMTGETGTGKELCARFLHLLSRRHLGPFIPVDCGALPDHLFENELFGHARGAYTDARTDQKGLVALAQRGTLFLDEIDSLSLAAQSKLLRLLQEHTYRPLGSEVFKEADVRILAATNRNLEELVEQKLFRSDLFFRINVLRVRLPALRERPSDIPLLSRHFLGEICRASCMPHKVLSHAAEQLLQQHDWPGNVRELHSVLQRAALCSSGSHLAASEIDLPVREMLRTVPRLDHAGGNAPDSSQGKPHNFSGAKSAAVQEFERAYIRSMMDKHQGNVTHAAREAGKDRRAFGRLAKKYLSLC